MATESEKIINPRYTELMSELNYYANKIREVDSLIDKAKELMDIIDKLRNDGESIDSNVFTDKAISAYGNTTVGNKLKNKQEDISAHIASYWFDVQDYYYYLRGAKTEMNKEIEKLNQELANTSHYVTE